MKNTISVLLIFFAIIFSGCKKEEGVGGDATIHGKVYRKHYNSTFSTLINEDYYPDAYVYIIYGANINYGQRIKTNYKGEFEFKYLYKGDYKIYTYSLDSAAIVNGALAPKDSAVVIDVSLNKRKENSDIGNIIVFK